MNHGGGEGDYASDKWKQTQNNLIPKNQAGQFNAFVMNSIFNESVLYRIAISFTQMRNATQKPIQLEFFSVDETIRTNMLTANNSYLYIIFVYVRTMKRTGYDDS